MPHADLKYSADMEFDARAMLQGIEDVLNALDPEAGKCKGRAYPAEVFLHRHLLVEVHMLAKPMRDAAFTARAMAALEAEIKRHVSQACEFSLKILYAPSTYITHAYTP